jgi:hypothetical protein
MITMPHMGISDIFTIAVMCLHIDIKEKTMQNIVAGSHFLESKIEVIF